MVAFCEVRQDLGEADVQSRSPSYHQPSPNVVEGESQSPGYRYFLSRLLSYRLSHVATPNSACMRCGANEPVLFPVFAGADFDARILPKDLRRAFLSRSVGHCAKCGFAQDFHRLSPAQVRKWVEVLTSKDVCVSEEAFHTYPVPQDYIDAFDNRYFSKRLQAWRRAVVSPPATALFLRPMFGASTRFFSQTYGTTCSALEISVAARRTIEAQQPQVRFLDGNIHADFFGPFLGSGPYDAVICFHTVVHTINAPATLGHIRSLLKPGGFALFTHEIKVKPMNPFHCVLADESHWQSLFKEHFSRVERVGDCEDDPPPHVARFTMDGTNPDYIVYR